MCVTRIHIIYGIYSDLDMNLQDYALGMMKKRRIVYTKREKNNIIPLSHGGASEKRNSLYRHTANRYIYI